MLGMQTPRIRGDGFFALDVRTSSRIPVIVCVLASSVEPEPSTSEWFQQGQ